MSAGVKYSTLPENADKILFAEDLVNHVLSKLDLPLLSSGIADHRALVYNAFGPETKDAVSYSYECAEEEIEEDFERFLKYNTIDIRHFEKYVTFAFKYFVGVFFPDESKSECFLTFCVRISMMAGKFYNRGILDAPTLAVDHIVNVIKEHDMVGEDGWNALNTIAIGWAEFYVYLSRDYMGPDCDVVLDNSPDCEGEGNPDEDLDESTDEEFRKVFIDSCSSSEEEPVSFSSDSRLIAETYEGNASNIVSSSDKASDSASTVSTKVKNYEVFFHSSQDTSKKFDISIQNVKPSSSYSKECKFDTEKSKTDAQIADDIYPFGRQSAMERSVILSSHGNDLNKSNSVQRLKISNSDNLSNESMNNSSTEDVQISVAKSGRRKKSVPKRRDVFASKR